MAVIAKRKISLTNEAERGLILRLVRRVFAENGREYFAQYATVAVCLILASAATAFLAWIMRSVIDEIFVQQNRAVLFTLPLAVFAAFTIRGLASYWQGVLLGRIGNNIVARYQRRLFRHLTELSVDFFHENRSAHLAAKINQNVSGIRDTLSLAITSIARDALSLIFLVGVMIWLDPLLSMIALLVGPFIAWTMSSLSKKLRKVQRQSIDLNARVLGSMQEAAQGITVVKAFTMEEVLRERIEALIVKAEARSNRIAAITERSGPITESLAGIAVAAVIAWSGYRAITYGYSPGGLFGFITALLLAYEPAKRLAKLQVQLERALVNAQMIYEILDIEPRQADPADARALAVSRGEIRFESVSFGYHPNEPVLRGLSFTAPAGKTTALIGASGGGKSTVIALIQRFYDVEGGRILVDGEDIRHVTKASLRGAIAYVSQQPYMFEGTIRDNIRFGRPDATDAEVEEAARLAQATEFIQLQSEGFDTPLGEGGMSLSGGQRQRLSIARALVRNAPILLLDEATSALDTRSEILVQQALDEAMKDRTVIVVAHRLSTIVNADQILVVDGGEIVERGTHGELLDQPTSVYSRFHNLQSRPGEAARSLAESITR